MKTPTNRTVFGISLLATSLVLSGCASLPNDGAHTELHHYDNLHTLRYIEIFVVGGNAITGDLRANVYNSTTRSDYDRAGKDSAPQAYVESLNLDSIKNQFHALGASLNGPKLWMLDSVNIPLGAERDFNGMRIPWCAELHLTKDQAKEMGKLSYVTTTIERKSTFGYNKDTTAYLIDDLGRQHLDHEGLRAGHQADPHV